MGEVEKLCSVEPNSTCPGAMRFGHFNGGIDIGKQFNRFSVLRCRRLTGLGR
jgi:hypothetical protein